MRAACNPFRTERLDHLRFRPQGATWDEIQSRLAEHRLRTAIVGPEGSGKTTLLEALEQKLGADGLATIRCGAWGQRSPAHVRDRVLLVDGADRLPTTDRLQLWWASMQAAGVIETRHRRGRLPVLLRTTTSVDLLASLTDELLDALAPPLPRATLDHLFRSQHGDLRRCLLELYDRFACDGRTLTSAFSRHLQRASQPTSESSWRPPNGRCRGLG